MLALARGKAVTGRALGNPVLQAEGRVTLVDACLAAAVLVGLTLNAAFGWWWADPLAGSSSSVTRSAKPKQRSAQTELLSPPPECASRPRLAGGRRRSRS